MIDYLDIRAIYHSSFSEEEKARRKAEIKPFNRDFLMDLPSQVRDIMDQLYWSYKDQPWFEEAWEKYREHVLDAGLGGKIKMPGFVFNEYIDRYVDEQEKRRNKELAHMDACDIDELYHHGIKGQRWGVRRYQNEDGTLTDEGKERYDNADSKDDSKTSKVLKVAEECNKSEVLKKAKCQIKVDKKGIANGESIFWKVFSDDGKILSFDGSDTLWSQEVGDLLWERLGRPDKGDKIYDELIGIEEKLLTAEYEFKGELDLEHHGIKGQKWGLRRFQNDDGTLTEEGKKRYGVDSNGNMSKEGSAKYREDRQKSLEAAKKDIRERDLNVKWFTKSADANRERLKLSKKYIEEKYGKQTAKDLYNQELKKELIAGGAALVAAAGVMTISIFNTIKR